MQGFWGYAGLGQGWSTNTGKGNARGMGGKEQRERGGRILYSLTTFEEPQHGIFFFFSLLHSNNKKQICKTKIAQRWFKGKKGGERGFLGHMGKKGFWGAGRNM